MPLISRRNLIGASAAVALAPGLVAARQDVADAGWSLPIRNAGGIPGDGFFVRHGFACENTWFNPGWWHTAEDWYRDGDADTAGAEVVAVAAGEVVFADFDYPGRVVIVQHAPELYSMYGHLDYALDVAVGQQVTAGHVIGRVLAGSGWASANHLHFEMRAFLIEDTINGTAPQHGVHCGYQCSPGPGYWPMGAEHPSALGWRNPAHELHRRMGAGDMPNEAMVTTGADGSSTMAYASPDGTQAIAGVAVRAGDRYRLREIDMGDPASTDTSALGYRVWYRLEIEPGVDGWVQAWVADDAWVGSDGRPSAVRPLLVPVS